MKYIIISPEKSTAKEPCFWRANAAGYTNSPFAAGVYDESEIKDHPGYYNNGYNSIAIPLTDAAMAKIGFECQIDIKALDQFLPKS